MMTVSSYFATTDPAEAMRQLDEAVQRLERVLHLEQPGRRSYT